MCQGCLSLKTFDKPLTAEEEKEMLERFHNGDMEARNILIEKNMRLVAHMIKKYISSDRDTQDLISIGTIGLIKAVNSFKTDKKIRLATYAAKCIDNELLMMLRTEKRKSREISIYEPIGKDKEGNEISFMEVVGEEQKDVVEDYIFSQRVQCIYKNIDCILTKREKMIIVKRYGLNGEDPKTQNQLAAQLGISRSYVSRIEKKSLMKLKKLLETNKL